MIYRFCFASNGPPYVIDGMRWLVMVSCLYLYNVIMAALWWIWRHNPHKNDGKSIE